jgi:hypothetical protein
MPSRTASSSSYMSSGPVSITPIERTPITGSGGVQLRCRRLSRWACSGLGAFKSGGSMAGSDGHYVDSLTLCLQTLLLSCTPLEPVMGVRLMGVMLTGRLEDEVLEGIQSLPHDKVSCILFAAISRACMGPANSLTSAPS